MLRSLFFSVFTLIATTAFTQPVFPDIAKILDHNKQRLDLNSQDLTEYTISSAYTTEKLGITHVYLEQRYLDIPLYNGILNLNLRAEQLLSFGNRWVTGLHTKAPSHIPSISAQTAVERSAIHLGSTFPNPIEIRREKNSLGQDTKVIFAPGNLSHPEIIATLVWLKHDPKEIVLCWMVEIHEDNTENVWRIFINAHTRAYVRKDNMVMQCTFDLVSGAAQDHCGHSNGMMPKQSFPSLAPDSSYNVFAMPVESPNHGTRSVEVRPWTAAGINNPATTLGWHKNGTTSYTITRGNNVHAYEDIDNNNSPGFSPDTSNLRFDYPLDPQLDPEDNMSAAITNLFYWNNITHDVMYQYGFDEVAGNFQVNNLGRGGLGADDVRAEALDGGGLNNANFFTPADGSRPRMQMYVWSPVSQTSPFIVNSPSSIAGPISAVESAFSTENLLEEIGLTTGDLVLVEDTGGMTHEACGTISNAGGLTGKIAVIDRGNCDFVVKVKNVQNHGAIAAIVIDNVAGDPFAMGGNDNTIVIPAVMISLNDGNNLKATMDTTVVNASLDSVATITPDGSYDNGIIVHEYGHGISTRLTGGPSNVSCLNNDEQMGEGWSDYFALMLTTDWTMASATDLRGIGTYVQGQTTNGTGIRTYPYTTNTTENPFTYADIADAPVTAGNPSVHFIGSVWCTMLWDMTWNIIEITGADPDIYHGNGGNNIALQLVIDALKLQPCSPGFVDGRDAIFLADQIRYGGQYACAIWEAFAGRGLGLDANQGSSNDHDDGVESFVVPSGFSIESAALTTQAMGEGQEVEFTVKTICGCVGKSDLEITDVMSEDLIYIPGSGGVLNGNTITFSADTLGALDTLEFSYRAFVRPCSAIESMILSEDDAEGPDQYASIKLAGTGTKQWVKSAAQSMSAPNSWYARNYSTLGNYALTLTAPVMINGPIEISFDHRYETEANYDGGVVEYSLNGGSIWLDAGPDFIENGYPATINTTNTNSPIAGQDAFTGDSDAQYDINGFIHSTIRLNLAGSQSLLVRFRFACDGGIAGPGINGWYVDNIIVTQLSGITNQTRVSADDIFVDSLYYGFQTAVFDGDILYVDPSASGERNGASWEDAMHYLPFALDLAACRTADSIFVAAGTYLPNLTNDRELSFKVPDNTSVFGGFPAGGSAFPLRDPISYITRLSGDIGIEDDNSDNVYHVVKVDADLQGALLDGVTLSDGNADGSGDHSKGAAVFCLGQMTLHDVVLSQNHGVADGQLILIREAQAHIYLHNCTIFTTNDALAKLLNSDSGHVTIKGNTAFILE